MHLAHYNGYEVSEAFVIFVGALYKMYSFSPVMTGVVDIGVFVVVQKVNVCIL